MLRRVQKYIRDKELLQEGDKVLVCVSGGADSVALLDVLLRSGYECVVAHCNFHLRGAESDRDEAFVRELCAHIADRLPHPQAWMAQGIPLRVRAFDTLSYARAQHVGVEVAARELRYTWFDEVARETGCVAIAVAHHQNDQAETVIMNIRRGCGINGLCGMRAKAKNGVKTADADGIKAAGAEGVKSMDIPIIRPLLCTTHEYICHYLRDIRGLQWVEDSTNSDTRFKRNAVREELSHWSKAEIGHVAELAERMQAVAAEI